MDTNVWVTLDQPHVQVGQHVRAVLSWQHDSQPAAVRLELRWFTEGRGDTDQAVVQQYRHSAETGPIPPQIEAALLVPAVGPVSYDGHLIRIRWEVRGVIELKWKRDPSTSVALLVGPGVAGPQQVALHPR